MNKIQTKTSLFLAIYWGTNVIKVALDFIHNSSNVLIQLQLANVIFFTIRLIACSPCIHYFLVTQTISILERYVLRAFRKENNVINCNHNFFFNNRTTSTSFLWVKNQNGWQGFHYHFFSNEFKTPPATLYHSIIGSENISHWPEW